MLSKIVGLLALVGICLSVRYLLLTPGYDPSASIPASLKKTSPEVHRISEVDLLLEERLPQLDFSVAGDRTHQHYLESEAAREFCAAHGYSVFKSPESTAGAAAAAAAAGEKKLLTDPAPPRRKVYDLFMVNTEIDYLEIRLDALYGYVDYFVVVESPVTFHGEKKPLTIRDNWDKFSKYHDKMIYHLLELPPGFAPKETWDYEILQRDATLEQVFPNLLQGTADAPTPSAPNYGDVLIVADVDEIPRPMTLLLLRTCQFPEYLTLASKFYYYSFQFLHTGKEWPHPQATFYKGMDDTIRPTPLRIHAKGFPLKRVFKSWWYGAKRMGSLGNAAWHCSSCFETMDEFLTKMASFSHTWMNEERFRDRDLIADAVRNGRDVWRRVADTFVRLDNNTDVPPLLTEQQERFRYMTNRDGETAGFTDYP